MWRAIALILALFVLPGCVTPNGDPGTQRFNQYLREVGYEPIVPPSTYLEPGSVIRYDNGVETPRAFRTSCAQELIGIDYRPTALINRSYDSDLGGNIDLTLKDLLKGRLDISAAAESGRVQKVTYSFYQPFVWSVDKVTIGRYIKASPDDCVNEAATKGNVIVNGIIGSHGYDLTFYGRDGIKISARATVLELVKASGGVSYSVTENGKVHVDSVLYFGYRIGEGFVGAGSNPVAKRESFYAQDFLNNTPTVVDQLRERSRSR